MLAVVISLGIFLFIFSMYPLLKIVFRILWNKGVFDFSVVSKTLTDKYFWQAFRNSLILGLSAAAISTIIGFIFAFSIVRTDMKGKAFFNLIATLPIIAPPFVMSLAMILLFGRSGLITRELLNIRNASVYGLHGLLTVQVLAFFPLAFLNIKGVLECINRSVEDAGESLGASKWYVFRTVTFPLCIPAVFSSFLLVFIKSISDFGNPQLLGGDFETLSSRAYLVINGMYDTRTGSLIAISILLPSVTAFLIERYWISRKSFITVTGKPQNATDRIRNRKLDYICFVFCAVLSLVVLTFYGTVILVSLVKTWGVDMSLSFGNFIHWKALYRILFDAYVCRTGNRIGNRIHHIVQYASYPADRNRCDNNNRPDVQEHVHRHRGWDKQPAADRSFDRGGEYQSGGWPALYVLAYHAASDKVCDLHDHGKCVREIDDVDQRSHIPCIGTLEPPYCDDHERG